MLGIGQVQRPEINVPEIMEAFGEAAKLNELLANTYYNGASEYLRDELIQEIAAKIVGARVEVRELDIPEGIARPIEGYYRTNGDKANVAWAGHDPEKLAIVRTYAQSDYPWVHTRFFRYRSVTRGKVEGVEDKGARLVVNPSTYRRPNKRDFITMAGPTGEPLVSLNVI